MSSALPQLDIAWILICAALVMVMQGGFCLLESGLVRAKNSFNVALKNLVDFCISSAVYWAFGFALMFGASYHGWFGTTGYFLGEDTDPWLLAFFIFQMVFCGTATTIISGAVAERIRFRGYVIIALFVSGLVYPLFGHWAWGGSAEGVATGWLAKEGFIDLAGSTVVHSVGGWVALAAVLVLGPRLGRFDKERGGIHGHNLTLATFGVLLMWFGWFGFNGGSTLAMNNQVPLILLNTNLAAAFGGLTGLFCSWGIHRRPDVAQTMNGVVAGLVGITASCHILAPWAAVVIGCGAGLICCLVTELLPRLKIDDVIGAFPAHACAGVFGTLALAFLADTRHFGEGVTHWGQFLVQLKGVTACCLVAFGGGFSFIYLVNKVLPFRTIAEHELTGLNISEHGASTDLMDLLSNMAQHREQGDFSQAVRIEPHTEVGQIAAEYNRVLTRVRSEMEQRNAAEHRFRGIFENAVEGIYQTTAEGQFMTANPALARMLGFDSLASLAESIADVATQVYVEPNRRREFVEIINEHGLVVGFESEIRRANGETMWVSENASARRDSDGNLLYYEGTVEDITERRKARRYQEEKNAADAANRAKSDFLASMSHEIRTPLNGIIGFLDLLANTHLDHNQQRFVDLAKSSAGTLLHLINDILDLSKIEAGGIEFEASEFVLHDLAESVPELFAPQGRERGLELNCCIRPDVPNTVVGDPERIRQVLVNLFSNAVKFTEHGGVNLQISVDQHDADGNNKQDYTIRFAVEDTGIGIPKSRIERLFKAFSQVDASTTRKYGGTGLGLAICKQLVELMGGEIGVESEAGKGSTFWFTIPLQGVERSLCDIIPNVAGLRVLAVDDNHMNLQVLKEQLQLWGVEVTTASSGERALAVLGEAQDRATPFDLAILDHIMPEMDGLTLASRISHDGKLEKTKLLMLTSYDRNISQDELKQLDMQCLTKPIRQSRLLDLLVTISGGRRPQNVTPRQNEKHEATTNDRRHVGAKILVVDDNEINRIVANEILSAEGFEVVLAENGREAVEQVTQNQIDLVLMDCEMPEMDGFEATRKIRGLTGTSMPQLQGLPIVALTAQAVKGDLERCLAAGMDGYVMKPVNRMELISVILTQLDESRPTRQHSQQIAAHTADESPASEAVSTAAAETFEQTATMDEADVTDQIALADLEERCGGDNALIQRVLGKFVVKARTEIDRLQLNVDSGAVTEIVQVAHSLKGMAANVGAQAVSQVAGTIELAGRQKQTQGYQSMLHELNQKFELCEQAVNQLLERSFVEEAST
ncbi:ammonium transporter [Bremerella cremea]|uniref:Sensory/regulatory protein RpfC n=1 Tax=Bremerella cremea TaxID=1031537 RepID=A0A368KII1_9BACT|nr:ammonium transporter [Bremerella cremea]RCS40391.1 ammonium transporter [Bremerella cremea]